MQKPVGSGEGAELFMVELHVTDLVKAVAWYVETLGFRVTLRDEPKGFALLEGAGARLALKQGMQSGPGTCRLVFRVDDVDRERSRLTELEVEVSPATDNPTEPYREIRLADPNGTPITVFAWTKTISQ